MAIRMGLTRFALIPALCAILLSGSPIRIRGQSVSNLHIGDDESKVAQLGSKPASTDTYKSFTPRRWRLNNGNDLSVTTSSSGRIVYGVGMEWQE
jgi:hypothetical protein